MVIESLPVLENKLLYPGVPGSRRNRQGWVKNEKPGKQGEGLERVLTGEQLQRKR